MRAELAFVALLVGVASSVRPAAAEDQPFGADEQSAEMNRRSRVQAVAMRSIANNTYSNGRFIQGTVANAADFPVYNVRICLENGSVCQSAATLPPGAQATFSFPTNLLAVPDWKVTWSVVFGEGP